MLLIVLLLLSALSKGFAVDRSKFRTCAQTSFCRRNRNRQHNLAKLKRLEHQPKEHGLFKSLQKRFLGEHKQQPTLSGVIEYEKSDLHFDVYVLQNGVIRMQITEHTPRVTYDHLVLEQDLSYSNETSYLVKGDEQLVKLLKERGLDDADPDNYSALLYDEIYMLVRWEPFQVKVYNGLNVVSTLGDNLHFEVRRSSKHASKKSTVHEEEQVEKSEENSEKEIVGYWEDGLAIYADGTREEKKEIVEDHRQLSETDDEGLWEEHFGSHTDSKPHGPMSVGMEIAFETPYVYGLPEHASKSVLQTTTGEDSHYKDPYRLYNLDVFEYELDEAMALYGEVPLIVSVDATQTTGVFWFNPSETFVDVSETDNAKSTHWISESGILDIFILPGPNPTSLYQQYGSLTGTTPLPPIFSLGYHQCRWNYKDQKDVEYVHSKFEELDYPYDVLWLDIEHTDGKRYFTWDEALFPDPITMQNELAAQGRRMVTIIDPHIKRDDQYSIHKEATSKGLYVKDKDGKKDYDGWCWPGSSSYLDFTAEHVRSWWASQFSFSKYKGSTRTLFTWNDMNEPSVFNGPEVSMQKDLKNLAGDEHREWHNIYGMLFHRATMEGQIHREADTRPFVLSRSFFAGSQKYGAIWTGDNACEWAHLEIATPMLLSLNVAALSFVGADVGGFFGDPNAELFTRWMQAGAYQPFFRGHAHHDSKRREPWTFDQETLVRLRKAAMSRYALLPYWYTVFYEAEQTGMPVMRMMWMQYPKTEELFALDDQYMVGSDLLVKPVTAEGVTQVVLLFPTDHLWYDVVSMKLASSKVAPSKVSRKTVGADSDTIPVYQRGGSIIPRKLRLRRSTMMMKEDPYTLYVALDDRKEASGTLYMDDGETFGYTKRSDFCLATFTATASELRNTVEVGAGWRMDERAQLIERIIFMGVSRPPRQVTVNGESIDFNFNSKTSVLVLRKPEVSAAANWTISITQK